MDLGIFAKTFDRPTVGGVFDAVRACGLRVAQFNMGCVGGPSMPAAIPEEQAAAIGTAATERGLSLAAVSGTFNMIHPDPSTRERGLRRLDVLAGACDALGTDVITLCTGTRDPDDKWRRHPANDTDAAWQDLRGSMGRALEIADAHDVTLAVEPEHANVVDTARKGERLIEEMGSDRLKVVFDPANLFETAAPDERRRRVEEGLALLGEHVVLAHAKDRRADGTFCPAGRGVLDYDHYLEQLRAAPTDAPLVLHGLTEDEVPDALSFLRTRRGRD
ncbi:MAG: sugar phosphate isomerase/epimerase family protein [Salinibacter sp.]